MSWLDKLPKELKLVIAIQNFDALAWLMLTDDKIYVHYIEHQTEFHKLFIEHEASVELITLLFDKLLAVDFMSEKPFTEYTTYIPVLIKQNNKDNKDNDYIYSYRVYDWRSDHNNWYKYTIHGNVQTWTLFHCIHDHMPHREDTADGRPLAAIITPTCKSYYKHNQQIYPQTT